MQTTLSAESRIVFLTAQGDASDQVLVDLLRAPAVDWVRVIGLGVAHKASSSLARSLGRLRARNVPAEVSQNLDRQRMISDFHMLHLQNRLKETLKSFASAGVPVMLLKGSAMGAAVYPRFTERPMADIDLLVRPEHTEAAVRSLGNAGWQSQSDPNRAGFYATHHHLEPFTDSRLSGHKLELHTSPFRPPNPFSHTEEDLWADAEPAGAEYHGALMPSRSHLFVYACIHLAWSHMMTRGAWRTFRDLNELARAGLDWDQVVFVARRWRASSATYWTVRLASTCTGSGIEGTVSRLQPPLFPSNGNVLERHLISQIIPGELEACPSVRLSRYLWRAAMRPDWSGHAGAMPPTDREGWLAEEVASQEPMSVGDSEGSSSPVRWGRFLRGIFTQ